MIKTKPYSLVILAVLSTCLSFSEVKAQCDPWIVNAYKLICNRNPSGSECNISNYNKGHWNSYAELVSYVYNYVGPIRGDQWIVQAYYELYNRVPKAVEMNVHNYNQGSWSSYADLKKYITAYNNSLSSSGINFKQGLNSRGNIVTIAYRNGQALAASELSAQAANVIAAGGGNVIAAGGGNVISAGGGNVIAAGGGNVISAGGGNLSGVQGGFMFGSSRQLQSAGTTIIPTTGGGALIIR